MVSRQAVNFGFDTNNFLESDIFLVALNRILLLHKIIFPNSHDEIHSKRK